MLHLLSFFATTSMKGFIMARTNRRYGCMAFLFDIILTFLTGGLWLIWIFVREMRG